MEQYKIEISFTLHEWTLDTRLAGMAKVHEALTSALLKRDGQVEYHKAILTKIHSNGEEMEIRRMRSRDRTQVMTERDEAWTLAMIDVLGPATSYTVPVVPQPAPFKVLFEQIRTRAKEGK